MGPAVAPARTLVPPPLTIQAEGLVLQRSTNMAGYMHVGQDKRKPRQFQVKMWHNGKQARLVRSPKVRAAVPIHRVASSDAHGCRSTWGTMRRPRRRRCATPARPVRGTMRSMQQPRRRRCTTTARPVRASRRGSLHASRRGSPRHRRPVLQPRPGLALWLRQPPSAPLACCCLPGATPCLLWPLA